ncbi:MAG: hypothetical protein KGS45_02030 [Planctomycetes bacterium]|nr:hypothetical protein [Planctomycetota bacterium]
MLDRPKVIPGWDFLSWFLVCAGVAIAYYVMARVARQRFLNRLKRTLSTPLCPACEYDLSTFADATNEKALKRCPECGTTRPLFVPPPPPDAMLAFTWTLAAQKERPIFPKR